MIATYVDFYHCVQCHKYIPPGDITVEEVIREMGWRLMCPNCRTLGLVLRNKEDLERFEENK